MENKEIYIDGVDVSGCDCYCDGKCLCEYNEINRKIIRYYSCNKFPNCYYKQLKAKEQECERLKKIIDEAKNSKLDLKSFLVGEAIQNEYEQQLDQLKAENEGLKKIIERLDVPKHEVIDMDIALENEKLKQALTEIKPILELYAISKVGEEQADGTYKFSGRYVESNGLVCINYDPRPAKQALQKISECEATNER